MKKTILLLVMLMPLLFCNVISAQTSQNGQTARDARKQQIDKYNQFKKERQQKYKKFLQEINADYEKFMRQKWENFKGNEAVKKPEPEPEPEPVIYEKKDDEKIEDRKVIITIEPKPEPLPEPEPVVVVEEVPVTVEKTVDITFYGAKLSFRYDKENNIRLSSLNENSVADAWHQLSDGRMNNLIRDCFDARKERDLCDWAYYQLIHQLTLAMYGDNNERVVTETYLLCQSGFRALMGRDDNNHLYMLLSTASAVYGYNYWIIDNERFYAIREGMDNVSLSILPHTFPESKALRLEVSGANRFGVNLADKRHLQSDAYPRLAVDVQSNKCLMKFYDTYPSSYSDGNFMTKWWFYAMTPMDEEMSKSLYPALKANLEGATQTQKVSMLLNFVQTAFVYGYDNEIWGGDRAFFPEETIFYPYSDCEDRSILFSRLVRDLVGLDVALIYYPGHLATAVALPENVSGDYFLIGGRRFTVCDPTYVNAPIGLTMTGMDNSQAKAIILK